MNDDLLKIYLNDHLAGSVVAVELAERCLNSNRENALGAYLETFLAEVKQEQGVVKKLIARIGGIENPAKKGAAWLAVKAGRLKLNGQWVTYSDLSRVEELEGLMLGVRGKLGLWAVCEAAGKVDDRFGGIDVEALKSRAQQQQEQLEEYRMDAARRAFFVRREEVPEG